MADDVDPATPSLTEDSEHPPKPSRGIRMGAWFGIATIVAVGALAAWLGSQAFRMDGRAQQEAVFKTAARQAALDLTTLDTGRIDAAVQRILDSSTGAFHEDFQQRAQPFAEVVKQTQASSEGTVTEVGLETAIETGANVLVAVAVKTTTAGVADQQPRLWRMRLTFEQVDATPKLSDVVFVP
jgi:Mce-associated membrane protein